MSGYQALFFDFADMLQMARRMGLSVIGLPHYTIWHAYEPSVDDIKHMEVS
jgi:mannan polymerase II complex ANP1 subunit